MRSKNWEKDNKQIVNFHAKSRYRFSTVGSRVQSGTKYCRDKRTGLGEGVVMEYKHKQYKRDGEEVKRKGKRTKEIELPIPCENLSRPVDLHLYLSISIDVRC